MEDLDDRVRAAMQALDDRAPARFDEDYAAKVEARLAEARMNDVTTEGTAADGAPPQMEDSGLHDIKALARTTRERVQRQSSQHDALRRSDDVLLSASSSGLHMVALPEPAKVVSLPSIAELATAEPAIARAAEKVSAEAAGRPRRRPIVWIAGAVVAAAAAAVGVIVVKGDKGDKQKTAASSSEEVAAGGAGAAAASGSAVAAATPTAHAAEKQTAADVAKPAPTDQAPAMNMAAAGSGVAAGSGSAIGAEGAGSGSAPGAGSGSGSAIDATLDAADAVPAPITKTTTTKGKVGDAAKDHGKTVKVETEKQKKAPETSAGGASKSKGGSKDPKSLDDLIDEAAGGPTGGGKPKQAETKPTLDKKELTPQDIRTAMGSIAKRAQGCYDKYGQAGTVGVKASVAPSGAVSKVTITGAFAGTPSGDCVANLVQSVSFPAWDGAPMTVNYSYLLSE